ncbi:putative Calcineurin-like phosphoesterase domain-containing protein [Seiridium cardinale]
MPSHKTDQNYRLLASEEDGDGSLESLPDDINLRPQFWVARNPSYLRYWKLLAMTLILIASFSLGYYARGKTPVELGSPYVNLAFNQPDTIWWTTQFSDHNASTAELNELWDSRIPWESGIIALGKEEARALDLPDSQPFPWDSTKKSIYIVNAHHILHCVRNLYISIQQYRANIPQTINYPHILHCLDSLRAETMCTADDTLRYVPFNSAHGFRPGDGQARKCRDWNKLQQFVETHDSCYRYLQPGNENISNLERFKFCPPESQYIPKIRKYFGHAPDWTPALQEGPRELAWR